MVLEIACRSDVNAYGNVIQQEYEETTLENPARFFFPEC